MWYLIRLLVMFIILPTILVLVIPGKALWIGLSTGCTETFHYIVHEYARAYEIIKDSCERWNDPNFWAMGMRKSGSEWDVD